MWQPAAPSSLPPFAQESNYRKRLYAAQTAQQRHVDVDVSANASKNAHRCIRGSIHKHVRMHTMLCIHACISICVRKRRHIRERVCELILSVCHGRERYLNTDQLKHMLIDSWAQLSQDTLNQVIDQLVIKLMSAHVEFHLDYLTMCYLLWLSEKLVKFMRCCETRHNFKCTKDLRKLGKEYLISLTWHPGFITFSRQNKLLTYHTPSYH